MDRVSAEFHKNVSILTKFVTPNDDFKKHFKEGIFDKPNTLGFISVSFFLLNIYYKDNIKNKVQWPVTCKQTENKFRNNVRECLMLIANENPDVNFPPIFASHLLLAKGKKFILIMWKFSLVVLRTHLTREYQSVISFTPKPGSYDELTKAFLNNFANHNQTEILNTRKKRDSTEKQANDFLRKKNEEQNELKLKILKMREDLNEILVGAPVNVFVRKRLINTDDNEIVNTWCTFLNTDTIKLLEKNHHYLKKLNTLSKSVSNIVSILNGNSKVLNALSLDRINLDPIYKLVPPEKQVLVYSLYNKENLILLNFFLIFNLLLQKMRTNVLKNQYIESFKYNSLLQSSNNDMNTGIIYFQNLHEQVINHINGEIEKTDEFNDTLRIFTTIPEYNKLLLMPSPAIQINSYETGRNNYPNHLKLTPIEGAHRYLFSRHAFNKGKVNNFGKGKPIFAQRINFDDLTMYDSSSDITQSVSLKRFTPTKMKSNFKNDAKYSRLFSSRTLIDSRVNNSVMSDENSMLPFMSKQNSFSLMNSSNLSQEFSQEPFLLNPNLNSTIEPSKLEDKEKIPEKSSKRRSIGDLVERYKKLIQKRDTNTQVFNSPNTKPLNEEMAI